MPLTNLGVYLLGMWYKRSEAQKRYSFFGCSTILAGAFGGLLASAIGKMDGIRGYRGWRWVFILEGVATCLMAVLVYYVIPDFPEDCKWLTEREYEFLRDKMGKETGRLEGNVKLGWRDVLGVFKDCECRLVDAHGAQVADIYQTRSFSEHLCCSARL
jgi:MFS family permease